MINYTVYNSTTGEVLRVGSCCGGDLSLQAGDGEVAIEGSYLDTEYYWNGSEMVEKPTRPSESHSWGVGEKQWVLDLYYLEDQIRAKRNRLLSECDWTQAPDAPVDQQAWATYRQSLRDLPANTTDPLNVAWPEKPCYSHLNLETPNGDNHT